MAFIPTVESGSVALYPLTRGVSFSTGVARFQSGKEQRWRQRAQLANFVLAYTELNVSDKNALLTFFEALKGQFDKTFQFAPGSTYNDLTMLSDDCQAVESSPGLYSLQFTFRQTKQSGAASGAGGSAYPSVVAQLPYTQIRSFQTTVNDNPTGPRYTYAWFGSGLTGFPSRSLRSWTIDYQVLTNAEAATLEEFFILQGGRHGSFSFTDPDDSVTYPNVRFAMDTLERKYLGPGHNSMTVTLEEFHA